MSPGRVIALVDGNKKQFLITKNRRPETNPRRRFLSDNILNMTIRERSGDNLVERVLDDPLSTELEEFWNDPADFLLGEHTLD